MMEREVEIADGIVERLVPDRCELDSRINFTARIDDDTTMNESHTLDEKLSFKSGVLPAFEQLSRNFPPLSEISSNSKVPPLSRSGPLRTGKHFKSPSNSNPVYVRKHKITSKYYISRLPGAILIPIPQNDSSEISYHIQTATQFKNHAQLARFLELIIKNSKKSEWSPSSERSSDLADAALSFVEWTQEVTPLSLHDFCSIHLKTKSSTFIEELRNLIIKLRLRVEAGSKLFKLLNPAKDGIFALDEWNDSENEESSDDDGSTSDPDSDFEAGYETEDSDNGDDCAFDFQNKTSIDPEIIKIIPAISRNLASYIHRDKVEVIEMKDLDSMESSMREAFLEVLRSIKVDSENAFTEEGVQEFDENILARSKELKNIPRDKLPNIFHLGDISTESLIPFDERLPARRPAAGVIINKALYKSYPVDKATGSIAGRASNNDNTFEAQRLQTALTSAEPTFESTNSPSILLPPSSDETSTKAGAKIHRKKYLPLGSQGSQAPTITPSQFFPSPSSQIPVIKSPHQPKQFESYSMEPLPQKLCLTYEIYSLLQQQTPRAEYGISLDETAEARAVKEPIQISREDKDEGALGALKVLGSLPARIIEVGQSGVRESTFRLSMDPFLIVVGKLSPNDEPIMKNGKKVILFRCNLKEKRDYEEAGYFTRPVTKEESLFYVKHHYSDISHLMLYDCKVIFIIDWMGKIGRNVIISFNVHYSCADPKMIEPAFCRSAVTTLNANNLSMSQLLGFTEEIQLDVQKFDAHLEARKNGIMGVESSFSKHFAGIKYVGHFKRDHLRTNIKMRAVEIESNFIIPPCDYTPGFANYLIKNLDDDYEPEAQPPKKNLSGKPNHSNLSNSLFVLLAQRLSCLSVLENLPPGTLTAFHEKILRGAGDSVKWNYRLKYEFGLSLLEMLSDFKFTIALRKKKEAEFEFAHIRAHPRIVRSMAEASVEAQHIFSLHFSYELENKPWNLLRLLHGVWRKETKSGSFSISLDSDVAKGFYLNKNASCEDCLKHGQKCVMTYAEGMEWLRKNYGGKVGEEKRFKAIRLALEKAVRNLGRKGQVKINIQFEKYETMLEYLEKLVNNL